MDKAYKIKNAARKAGTKLDEAGMKAFEKVYDVAKKAGPGAAGLVADPKTAQRAYDAVSSYLPGGPPASSPRGFAGYYVSRQKKQIKNAAKATTRIMTGAGNQFAKDIREASIRNTNQINQLEKKD